MSYKIEIPDTDYEIEFTPGDISIGVNQNKFYEDADITGVHVCGVEAPQEMMKAILTRMKENGIDYQYIIWEYMMQQKREAEIDKAALMFEDGYFSRFGNVDPCGLAYMNTDNPLAKLEKRRSNELKRTSKTISS